jgi:hypothetical protein
MCVGGLLVAILQPLRLLPGLGGGGAVAVQNSKIPVKYKNWGGGGCTF